MLKPLLTGLHKTFLRICTVAESIWESGGSSGMQSARGR